MIFESDTGYVQTYKDALSQGRLILRACRACGVHQDYPRYYCPSCGSADTHWVDADGAGEIYSVTIWRLKSGALIPAFVTLREGPGIMALIRGDDGQKTMIGHQVRFVGMRSDDALPIFSPMTIGTP